MAVSTDLSSDLFEDGHEAYGDTSHPCHHFRHLQPGVSDERWQLPEPFTGHEAQRGLVFLGGNPSYDPAEPVPTVNDGFDYFDRFYRERFDAGLPHPLYEAYQEVGARVFDDFRLGRDAVIMDAVRLRSRNGEGITSAVIRHQARLGARVLAELRPRVLVAAGWDAANACKHLLRMVDPIVGPLGREEAEGTLHRAYVGDQRLLVVPVRHLSGNVFGSPPSLNGLAERIAQAFAVVDQ